MNEDLSNLRELSAFQQCYDSERLIKDKEKWVLDFSSCIKNGGTSTCTDMCVNSLSQGLRSRGWSLKCDAWFPFPMPQFLFDHQEFIASLISKSCEYATALLETGV